MYLCPLLQHVITVLYAFVMTSTPYLHTCNLFMCCWVAGVCHPLPQHRSSSGPVPALCACIMYLLIHMHIHMLCNMSYIYCHMRSSCLGCAPRLHHHPPPAYRRKALPGPGLGGVTYACRGCLRRSLVWPSKRDPRQGGADGGDRCTLFLSLALD